MFRRPSLRPAPWHFFGPGKVLIIVHSSVWMLVIVTMYISLKVSVIEDSIFIVTFFLFLQKV